MFVDLKHQYRKSLKSYDTEEGIDLAFYRPIGFAWAYLFRKLGVTPNAVTIASVFLGVAGGVCFYYPELWINVVGMLLLVWANSFDSADGQLARMTGQFSKFGRILDGLSGDLWFITIYVALCLRVMQYDALFASCPWLIWVIAAAAGASHIRQAAMADYYRQFHLFFVKGEDGSELDLYADLRKRLDAMSWRKDFWSKITLTFYAGYTKNQEDWNPAMLRLRGKLAEKFGSTKICPQFRQDFRKADLPMMKYTNILTFNWRTIILFVSLFINCPWLYFAFELIVLNAILVYMWARHENICKRFTQSLDDGSYKDV